MARCEIIGAIAMTEPAASSDLVIVVAKTDPSGGAMGISLLLVERGRPGFE